MCSSIEGEEDAYKPCPTAQAVDRLNIQHELATKGFARMDASQFCFDAAEEDGFAEVIESASRLPTDPFGVGSRRARLYGRGTLLPCRDGGYTVSFLPGRVNERGENVLPFVQPVEFQPEFGGVRRELPTFHPSMLRNAALQKMIMMFFSWATFGADVRGEPIQVGLHLIRLEPGEAESAVATPNCIHRDGEPFTCAVLIARENASGGENFVTDMQYTDRQPSEVPAEGIRASFTLEKPGEAYMVVDDMVAHHVAPVRRLDPSKPGYRTILLIDFTPLRPALAGIAAE